MNLKGLFVFICTGFIPTGCVSEFNAQLPSGDTQILIVDGNIVANTEVTFHLSKSFPLNSFYTPEENLINDAILTLIDSTGNEISRARRVSDEETYRLAVPTLDDNMKYGIRIEYDGDIFQSIPAKPLHTPEIDTVSYIQKQKDGTVFFRISTHDEESGSRFFLWNYVEDWEIWADIYYCGAPADYFCWKNDVSSYKIGSTESLPENRLVNKELYQCDPQNDRFSVLYSVVVFQKSLSKEAYEYYQNKMKLNEDMGGLFTPQPFEITGNIACITDQSKKVMGYVEVIKNTAQKRIFVPRDSITRQPVVTNCKALSLDYVTKNNIDVTGMIMLCEEGGWTYPSCTKCRTKGGTKNKPDFWPNN